MAATAKRVPFDSYAPSRRRHWRGSVASIIAIVAAAFIAFRIATGALAAGRSAHRDIGDLFLDAGAIVASIVIVIGAPVWVLWWRGQRRNQAVLQRRPGALLMAGTRVEATLESALRLGSEQGLLIWFACAVDRQGVSIWQGASPVAPLLDIPAADIAAVQCVDIDTGRRAFQAVSFVVDAEQGPVSFTFLARRPRRPLIPASGPEVESLVDRIRLRLRAQPGEEG